MKLVITGSKGLIGRHTADYARTQPGVEVFGVDLAGPGDWRANYAAADMTDAASAYTVLAGADAVIHLAAIRDHAIVPEPKLFLDNVASAYHVLEAARHLRLKRVVLASSVQVSRTVRMHHDTRYQYLPLDEAHPVDPQNDYALSKQVGEVMGEMYARTYGLSVVNLRFGAITRREDMQGWPTPKAEPPHWALYAYADVRDAARCAYLAAVADLPPATHHVAYVVAPDTMVDTPSADIARRFFPDAQLRAPLEGNASLISPDTARRLFGFQAEYSCRR